MVTAMLRFFFYSLRSIAYEITISSTLNFSSKNECDHKSMLTGQLRHVGGNQSVSVNILLSAKKSIENKS